MELNGYNASPLPRKPILALGELLVDLVPERAGMRIDPPAGSQQRVTLEGRPGILDQFVTLGYETAFVAPSFLTGERLYAFDLIFTKHRLSDNSITIEPPDRAQPRVTPLNPGRS